MFSSRWRVRINWIINITPLAIAFDVTVEKVNEVSRITLSVTIICGKAAAVLLRIICWVVRVRVRNDQAPYISQLTRVTGYYSVL